MADDNFRTGGNDQMAALIANSGKTDPKMWEALGNIPKAYYEGRDQAYKQKTRDVFSDENGGLPRDKDGNVDFQKAFERVMSVGGAPVIDSASKLAETGFQQDRYRNAPTVQAALDGRPDPSNYPPSSSRNAVTQVAPATGGGQSPPGRPPVAPAPAAPGQPPNHPSSLVSFLSAQGVPDELAGSQMNILGGKLSQATGKRIDPNGPMDMNDPKVRQVLVDFARQQKQPAAAQSPAPTPVVDSAATNSANGAPAPTSFAARFAPAQAQLQQQPTQQLQPTPQSQAALPASGAQPTPATTDPTLGGLVPAGYEPGAYVRRLEAVAGSGRVLPDQLKVLQGRIEGIRKALEPTPDMKNARAAGMPLKDYLDRSDTNMADRDILTKSILPKLDKSQEAATAARDEIQAIHRSREQLDAPGGIFTGAAADVRLKVAKVAEFLGVPNTDKIANTEAFGSAIGSRVLSLVKGLGAGTGISNADRDFAAAMAGGNIKLDEKSIRKILDIGEKGARVRIDQHNGLADKTLKTTESLKNYGDVYRVEQPGQYQRIGATPAPRQGDVVDGHRYLGGNPKDPRSWGGI